MNDPRETAARGAEGERKNSQAKGSDQDGTSESAIAKIGPRMHTKGATDGLAGNLSGYDGGRRTKGVFLSLFMPITRQTTRGRGKTLLNKTDLYGGTT